MGKTRPVKNNTIRTANMHDITKMLLSDWCHLIVQKKGPRRNQWVYIFIKETFMSATPKNEI